MVLWDRDYPAESSQGIQPFRLLVVGVPGAIDRLEEFANGLDLLSAR
jgi:hypothetical protein